MPHSPPPKTPTERLLREYLGQVRSHLPVRAAGDVVDELESSILDRADAIAASEGGRVDEATMRRALDEVGEPERVAAAFVPQVHVVPPEHARSFLVWTALAFAVHLALVGVATSSGHALHFGPAHVSPVGPHGLLSFLAAAAHALLLDLGIMVIVFAAFPRVRRVVGRGVPGLGVDAAPRSAGARALLATLTGVILWAFRDRLFVVMDGPDAHPLFTPYFAGMLWLVLSVLGLAIVVDAGYVVFGERRGTVVLDAVHGAATLAVMLHLLRGEPLLAVPPVAAFDEFRPAMNGFLDDLGTFVLLVLAAVAAVKTVRRLVRCAQL